MTRQSFFGILKSIWILAGIAFTCWLVYSMQAHGVQLLYFQNNEKVLVENGSDYTLFSPKQHSKNVLIFFPGALVDPDAYVPLCHQLAENGVKTYLIKMPWRQAKYGYNKIKELNILAGSSENYVIAGHSQGAKMAAQFVYENPGLINKAILLGTTHPKELDLSKSATHFLKIYGSLDGVAKEKEVEANKSKLPSDTKYVKIAGGNHSQFGYYGFQLGDKSASISREDQHQLVLSAMLDLIGKP